MLNNLFFSFLLFLNNFSLFSAELFRPSSNWAVLVAGSNGYYNYRHQADVAHAYQILTKIGNFPPNNVIVMMYDDIANNDLNVYKGQLFNEPDGSDVYKDIKIDYKGDEVNAVNFLNVLMGNQTFPNKPVLKSKKNDNVFIFYSDHGAPGLIAMPSGDPVFADDLINALKYMSMNEMYSEMVFYLEACESGSMFNQILPNNIKIFATTAANPTESSYAYYYNQTLGTFIADEYSIRWMQDSTANWHKYESIEEQFESVQKIVTESHPQKYGDESFESEPIEDFEGFDINSCEINKKNNNIDIINNSTMYKKKLSLNVRNPFYIKNNENWKPPINGVKSSDVKLYTLQHRYLNPSNTKQQKKFYKQEIAKELAFRLYIDGLFTNLVRNIIGLNDFKMFDILIHKYFQPKNFECLKKTYKAFEGNCGKFNDYSLQYVRTLVNLCEVYNDIQLIINNIQVLCQ